jgi:L-lactate dehydrogenase complex protein LldG
MGSFLKVLSVVKTALHHEASTNETSHNGTESSPPVEPPTRQAELVSAFAREIEALNGVFLGAVAPGEVVARACGLAERAGALGIAVGEGEVIDLAAIAVALEGEGREVMRAGAHAASDEVARKSWLGRLARADLGIVEARCAIASSGTLVIVATPESPGSLTLVPPISLIIVRADRIMGDTAQAIEMLGAATISGHRVVMISGPSRTADIEKRIVLGVHGPKELHVLVVWPNDL